MNRLAGAVLAVLVVSCGSFRELPVPSSAYPQTYFTVRPPQERGWVLRSRSDTRVVFERKGTAPGESYQAFARVTGAPEFTDEAAFQDYVKAQMVSNAEPDRFKNAQASVEPHPQRGAYCVQIKYRVEDHKAEAASDRSGFMLIDRRAFFCRHPVHAKLLGGGVYTRHHYPEDADPTFEEKAEAFLAGVILHE